MCISCNGEVQFVKNVRDFDWENPDEAERFLLKYGYIEPPTFTVTLTIVIGSDSDLFGEDTYAVERAITDAIDYNMDDIEITDIDTREV